MAEALLQVRRVCQDWPLTQRMGVMGVSLERLSQEHVGAVEN